MEVDPIHVNPVNNIINQTNSTNQTASILNNQTNENPIQSISISTINKIIQKIYNIKIAQIDSLIANKNKEINYYDNVYMVGGILGIIALTLGIIAGICWALSIPTGGISAYWAAIFTAAAAAIGTAGGVCAIIGWKYGDNHKKTKEKLICIKTDLENREIHSDL